MAVCDAQRKGFVKWLVLAILGVMLMGLAAFAAPQQALAEDPQDNGGYDVGYFWVDLGNGKTSDRMVKREKVVLDSGAMVFYSGMDWSSNCSVVWTLGEGADSYMEISQPSPTLVDHATQATLKVKDDKIDSIQDGYEFTITATLWGEGVDLETRQLTMHVVNDYYDVRFTQEDCEAFQLALPTQSVSVTSYLVKVENGTDGAIVTYVPEQVDHFTAECETRNAEVTVNGDEVNVAKNKNEDTRIRVSAFLAGQQEPCADACFSSGQVGFDIWFDGGQGVVFTNADYAVSADTAGFQGVGANPNEFVYDTDYFLMGYMIMGFDAHGEPIVGVGDNDDKQLFPDRENNLIAVKSDTTELTIGTMSAFQGGRSTFTFSQEGLEDLYDLGVRFMVVYIGASDVTEAHNRIAMTGPGKYLGVSLQEPEYKVVDDGQFFPGDTFWLDKNTQARVRDGFYPEGADINAAITSAVITPAEQRVVDVTEETEGWNLEAKNTGEVTATVTYTLDDSSITEGTNHYAGEEFTDVVTLKVTEENWQVDINFSGGNDRMLPESEKTATPSVALNRFNKQSLVYPADLPEAELQWGLIGDSEGVDPDEDEMGIDQLPAQESEHFKIAKGEGGSITIESKGLGEGEDEAWVSLRLSVFMPDEGGQMVEVARNERNLCICRNYSVLMAAPGEGYTDVFAECGEAGVAPTDVPMTAAVMNYFLDDQGQWQCVDVSDQFNFSFREEDWHGARSDRNLLQIDNEGDRNLILHDEGGINCLTFVESGIDATSLPWEARIRVEAEPKDEQADHDYGWQGTDFRLTLCGGHAWKYAGPEDDNHDVYACGKCGATKIDDRHECVCRDHVTKYASPEGPGVVTHVCTVCGKMTSDLIAAPAKVELSESSVTYTGGPQGTTVTAVKDSKGNVIDKKYYEVSYPPVCKNAGTYDVTITFGNGLMPAKSGVAKIDNPYAGELVAKFTVKPVSLASAKLSATTYTYNGKVRKPAVTATATVKGKTVTIADAVTASNDNVTVTYASGCKVVGKYKVTVKGKGNYTGTKTLYFTINPSGTTLSSVTAVSKGFTATWKAQKTQTTGYEIRYSTSSKMTSAKIVPITKNTTVSKKVTGLTAGKKYYVQVRTYKSVSGTKYYSAWSASKAVTTKK